MTKRLIAIAAIAVALMGVSGSSPAASIIYTAALKGASETPPNTSTGSGTALVTLDTTANTLHVQVTFINLTGTTTASHIHAPTAVAGTGSASVATQTPTFTSFPLGVTSGNFDQTLDLSQASSYNPAFISANGGTVASAESVLLAALANGTSYLNIHTTAFPGGEISGFLVGPTAVPEPSSVVLMGLGVLGLMVRLRRRAVRA